MRIKIFLLGLLSSVLFTPAFAQPASVDDAFAVAHVVRIISESGDTFAGINRTVQLLEIELESGPRAGQIVRLENGVLEGKEDLLFEVGDRLVTESVIRSDGVEQIIIKEPYRLPSLLWLTLLFVATGIALGGWTGLTSLLGLGVSVLTLLFFVVPRIVAGGDPLSTSIIGCAVIAGLSLYLAHGLRRRTSVALLATIITLVIAAILAFLFVHAASLFGMGSEESLYLQMGALEQVNLRGLLLGGMLLGCLGVLDDITTAQCAAIEEISKANPRLSSADLRLAGLSVGREHIASLINTLALAYAGASLPLLLLLDTNSDFPLWVTLNGEFLAEEIVRTLVGSMALLFAVPISTWLASSLLRAAPGSHPETGSHLHHRHS